VLYQPELHPLQERHTIAAWRPKSIEIPQVGRRAQELLKVHIV